MVYGFSATMSINQITINAITGNLSIGSLFGLILILIAILFKVSAAPFHMWSPDVYEGSNIVATTFFASLSKLSFLIIFSFFIIQASIGWQNISHIIILVSILSFIIGSFGAIKQTNLKRIMAYSSIGHVGFMLVVFAKININAFYSFYFYAIIYGFLTIAVFSFLMLIKNKNSKDKYDISNLAGFSKTYPVLALLFASLMFSLAGIPPVIGFFSKFYILNSIISASKGFYDYLLPISMIIYSAIAAFYYLRIVKIMYFDDVSKNIIIDDKNKLAILIFVSLSLLSILALFFIDHLVLILTETLLS